MLRYSVYNQNRLLVEHTVYSQSSQRRFVYTDKHTTNPVTSFSVRYLKHLRQNE